MSGQPWGYTADNGNSLFVAANNIPHPPRGEIRSVVTTIFRIRAARQREEK